MKLWLGVGAVAIVLALTFFFPRSREARSPGAAPDVVQAPDDDPRPAAPLVPALVPALARAEPELGAQVVPALRERARVDADAPLGTAPLRGIVSARGGARIQGALVRVSSFERRDGGPRFTYETTTGVKGDFAFALAVGVEATAGAGQEYLIHASHPGYETATQLTPPMRAGLGVERNLSLNARTESPCELEVFVRDADGPLLGVTVLLYDHEESKDPHPRRVDVSPTDGEGRVVLASNVLGSKTILVRDHRGGRQTHREEVHRSRPGRSTHTIVLQPGLVIAGIVRTVEGELYDGIKLRLDPDAQLEAEQTLIVSKPGGRFRAEGIAPGVHVLESLTDDRRWSPFRVQVLAGDEELELVLKDPTDDMDHGLHLGEIHGTLRLPAGWTAGPMDIRIEDVSHVDAEALEGDWLPNLLSDRARTGGVTGVIVTGGGGRTSALRLLGEGVVYETAGSVVDFHFFGLEDGDYCVLAADPEAGPAFAGPIAIRNQALVSGVQLVLPPVTIVAGRVVDAEGRPVAGARVFITGSGARSEARIREARAGTGDAVFSDVDGTFELAVPARIPIYVVASRSRWEPARTGPRTLAAGSVTSGLQVAFSERDP